MANNRNHTNVSDPNQMELTLTRPLELDRNFHLGGKSFYFFDFDDNVAYLSTPVVIFHKDTGKEHLLSSGEFARVNRDVGKNGQFKDYFMDFCDAKGTFRNFRDKDFSLAQRLTGKKQSFVQDVETAIRSGRDWKAPSWDSFYHATYNQRPVSVITARGHRAETIKEGISLMVKEGHLPKVPNWLSVFAVSNPDVRKRLGDSKLVQSVAELKRAAIRESVEEAIRKYGHSDFHRFGMSDDDEGNIELIVEEMKVLKQKYSNMSFFVIQTFEDSFIKWEVLEHKTRNVISRSESSKAQMNLF